MLDNLDPQCITRKVAFGHSAEGYLLPCCWCDKNNKNKEDKYLLGLFSEHLNMSKVNSIEEILLSDEWQSFYEAIKGGWVTAPAVCKIYCSINTPRKKLNRS